jgi:hypothetical protein
MSMTGGIKNQRPVRMKPFRLKPKYPSEHIEQRDLFKWARMREATCPDLKMLFACPNGGTFGDDAKTRVIRGAHMKAEGLKPGVPDICLPVPRDSFHGLFIELKRRMGGRVSPEQNDWLDRLNAQGYRATVAYGWDDARRIIESYLELGKQCG